ncbi:MAG: phosphatase PAP2 family protein [candidate division SR1 bacterium]|nr:phosphatase PAP2 family protein [candidate division SR1 bacterium]
MLVKKLTNIDLRVSNWIYSKRQKWLTAILIIITNTMDKWLFIPIFGTFLCFINYANWQFVFVWFWGMVFCAFLFNSILKIIFKRPRPSQSQLVSEKHYSFPSGHVMTTIQVSFQSLYLFIQNFQSTIFPYHILVCAILFVLVIAFSRVYLGVHYVSDTIGSVFFGSISVAISIFVFQNYIQ